MTRLLASAFFWCFTTILAADHPGAYLRSRPTNSTDEDGRPQLYKDNDCLPITFNDTTLMQDHRRLQRVRTVLVVRVINAGIGPSVSASTVQQYTFTDPNSLKAQMMRCSANALILTESRYGSVIDVHVNTAMRASNLKVAARDAAMAKLGDLRAAANHIMFIFPKISDYLAEAETGYNLSYFNDNMGVSLGVVMHEIGHNLGLYHSGFNGDEYGDYSGSMGLARVRRGGPLMCFNAANHWDLGWFGGTARRDLGSYGPSTPLQLSLNAFSNVPLRGVVLLKVAHNIYMQYNHASAHNIDTDALVADTVVIVRRSSNGATTRLAALGPGQEYKSNLFVVRACARTGMSMDISIGRSYTNCNTARPPTNVWSGTARQPTPTSFWSGGSVRQPTPTSVWPRPPAPTPWSQPAPTSVWSTPTNVWSQPTPTNVWSGSTTTTPRSWWQLIPSPPVPRPAPTTSWGSMWKPSW